MPMEGHLKKKKAKKDWIFVFTRNEQINTETNSFSALLKGFMVNNQEDRNKYPVH